MTRPLPKTVLETGAIWRCGGAALCHALYPTNFDLKYQLFRRSRGTKEGHIAGIPGPSLLIRAAAFHLHNSTLNARWSSSASPVAAETLIVRHRPIASSNISNADHRNRIIIIINPPAAMARPRITVLGSLNIDLVSYVPHHPLPGETLTANHFNTSPGGKGANQAVACGKLSRSSDLSSPAADVSMIGAVGSDTYGQQLISSLTSYGVDTSAVAVREDGKTGIAIIVVDEPSGQNRIILSAEANHTLLPEHFSTLPGPRPDLLIMQLEIPFDTVLQALRAANASNIPVLLNPAPAKALPAEAYTNLAHLVVNETEAAILSGCQESDLDDVSGLERVSAIFFQRGVSNVIITLGGRGVYYATKDGKSALVPALKANVVDTTAAGDTFVGSYALAVVSAGTGVFDIDTAIRAANRAAAITVSRKGAQISIPWKDELN